jgi:hypothetical protein
MRQAGPHYMGENISAYRSLVSKLQIRDQMHRHENYIKIPQKIR